LVSDLKCNNFLNIDFPRSHVPLKIQNPPDTSLCAGKDVKARYNGNIAEVDWRTVENIGYNPSLTPKRYSYAYDKLNRLTAV